MSALTTSGPDFDQKMSALMAGQGQWSRRLENDLRDFWGDKLCGVPDPGKRLTPAVRKALVALYEAYGQPADTQRALEAA